MYPNGCKRCSRSKHSARAGESTWPVLSRGSSHFLALIGTAGGCLYPRENDEDDDWGVPDTDGENVLDFFLWKPVTQVKTANSDDRPKILTALFVASGLRLRWQTQFATGCRAGRQGKTFPPATPTLRSPQVRIHPDGSPPREGWSCVRCAALPVLLPSCRSREGCRSRQ
jgi:hypothetical protein